MNMIATDIRPRQRLRVVTHENIVSGQPSISKYRPGVSLAEIAASVKLSHEALRSRLSCEVDGQTVPREWWPYVRPKPEHAGQAIMVSFTFRFAGGGEGGGGGRKIISAVAAIALIAVSAGALAPVLGPSFAAGTLGAQLAGGAIAIGASLLLQGLQPKPPKAPGASETIGFASAQNNFEPGAPLHRVMGPRRYAPQHVMTPFTTREGKDQYVHALMALAGRHIISDPRNDGVDLADAQDIEYELREGTDADAALTLITDTRHESQPGIQMSEWKTDPDDADSGFVVLEPGLTLPQARPLFHRVETKQEPDAFRIDYLCSNGLYEVGNVAAGFALRHRFRRKTAAGWTAWMNIPELVVRALESSSPIPLTIRFEWVDAYPAEEGNAWPPTAKAYSKVKGWAKPYISSAWSSPLFGTSGTGFVGFEWVSETEITFYLLTASFPKGRYQFEAMRSWPFKWSNFNTTTNQVSGNEDLFGPVESAGSFGVPENPARFHDDLVLTTIQNRWDVPPVNVGEGNPKALIAVRAKNRQLGTVTVHAGAVVQVWDGSDWVDTDEASDNPAALYRDVMRAPHNARAPADAQRDDASLADWYEWCESHNKRCALIADGRSVPEMLSAIALTGFAAPAFEAKHGVVVDRLRLDGPVGIVSQRNAYGFAFEKLFPDTPHALRVTYQDEDEDYEANEVVVYAPGYDAAGSSGSLEATLFEAVTYEGIVTEAQAVARGERDIAWMVYRNRIVTCRQDVEQLEHRQGALLMVETDIIGQEGGRGRVKEILLDGGGDIEGLVLDEQRDFTAADAISGGQRGAAIRLRAPEPLTVLHVAEVTSDDTSLDTIMFAAPFPMPQKDLGAGLVDLIVPGSLVVTGTLGQEARPMILQRKDPGPDLTADLTLVDYASLGVYGSAFNSGSADAFSSGFSAGFR
jgi:hypothetical protein